MFTENKSETTTDPDSIEEPQTQSNTTTCPECNGTIRLDGDERICTSCGLIIEENNIDHGPEWRTFNDSTNTEQRKRVGSPLTNLQHDNGLSTNIGSIKRDGYGNTLSSEQRMKMTRLQKLNKRYKTKNSKERNLQRALNEIQRMASALGLNKPVQETASQLYRECLRKDMLLGRSIEGMSSACLYAASRICNSPRTLDDFRPVSLVSTPATGKNGGCEIERAYRYISKELDIGITPPDPRQYVNRLLNSLDVNSKQQLRSTAMDAIEIAEEANIHSGCAPMSIAASAVYIACGTHDEHVSQDKIADVAELSPTTIRARYQEIIKQQKNIDSPQHMFSHVA